MPVARIWKSIILVAVIIGGCSYEVEISDREIEPELTPIAEYDDLRKIPGLEWYEVSQGWNSELRRAFWFTPQGSALVPYDWFLHLEMPERNCKGQPDTSLNKGNWSSFRDNGHLRSLSFIPAPSDPTWNPDGLPIGFARSRTIEGDFMGPTCAACHSNLMVLNGRKVLVEGAPTLADLQGLNVGLANALCSIDPSAVQKPARNQISVMAAKAQFTRFAKRVLKDGYKEESAKILLQRVKTQRLRIQRRNARNYDKRTGKYPPYGKGRLDALGAILNEVAVNKAKTTKNIYSANAPVSYPFLWGTPQSDVVQWNGAVDNQSFGFGPLGRNVGEVVGVYGHVDVFPTEEGEAFLQLSTDDQLNSLFPPLLKKGRGPQLGGFDSSVLMANLGSIEHWISLLRSPKWPEKTLGQIDRAKAALGRKIYMGEARTSVKCVGCHRFVARKDQDKPYQSTMIRVSEIGTDPTAANNFILEANPTTGKPWESGQFKGMKKGVLFGERYGESFIYRGEALSTAVVGVILGDLFLDGLKGGYRSLSVSEETKFINPLDKLYRYKARPLTGIWATAPYLHNGSVASLAQLLTPDERRVDAFCVGNRDFDPKEVGFGYKAGDSAMRKEDREGICKSDKYGATLLDTTKFGNSNKGHSTIRHGVMLNDDDKRALIEFLKTL